LGRPFPTCEPTDQRQGIDASQPQNSDNHPDDNQSFFGKQKPEQGNEQGGIYAPSTPTSTSLPPAVINIRAASSSLPFHIRANWWFRNYFFFNILMRENGTPEDLTHKFLNLSDALLVKII
jgi:hypothetical protein